MACLDLLTRAAARLAKPDSQFAKFGLTELHADARPFGLVAFGFLRSRNLEQTTLQTGLLRSAGTATAADCDRQVSQATILNGPDLLLGHRFAFANRPIEGSFLLNAGQVRSSVDLVLTVPPRAPTARANLSLWLHLCASGRTRQRRRLRRRGVAKQILPALRRLVAAIFGRLQSRLECPRRPDATTYRAATEEVKAGRRRQLLDACGSIRTMPILRPGAGSWNCRRAIRAALSRARRMPRSPRTCGGRWTSGPWRSARNPRRAHTGSDDPSSVRFPPHQPAADEEILSSSADPVVQRCADMVERMTIAEDTPNRPHSHHPQSRMGRDLAR